jgi:triacylglycerol esterase/lipase EstA (alpha/beta hydrolase family)
MLFRDALTLGMTVLKSRPSWPRGNGAHMFATRHVWFGAGGWVLLASGCGDASTADESALEALAGEHAVLAARDAMRPVVLVAGLMQDAATVAPLAEALREADLDVTVWVPDGYGLGDIQDYAESLADAVEQVLAKTGATQVDLVGHSEGGLTSRLYVKNRGDDAPVHTLVSLGSPQQGTEGGC